MSDFVLGGGCFWCLDALFRRLQGVTKVESGYAGGDTPSPRYYTVASGTTGHAEVVRITFEPSIIPADTILDIFFLIHDPTTIDRQGADVGSQYRSIMLFSDPKEQQLFESAKKRAQKLWSDPIVTEIKRLDAFYPAEDEHQDYYDKHPDAGYCQIVISPKLAKVRKKYEKWFKKGEAS